MTKHTTLPIDELRALIDYDPSTGLITRRSTGKPALFTVNHNGYLWGRLRSKVIMAHRAAWAWTNGEWAETIDHINRTKTDNRIVNLRSVSAHLNALNKDVVGGQYCHFRGVAYLPAKGRYTARIAGRYLGCFIDAEAAARAFDRAANLMSLPREMLNFPNETST